MAQSPAGVSENAERSPPWPSLPSSLLRLVLERVRTSTVPAGLYKTDDAARACSRTCRGWRDAVGAEARTLRWRGGGGGRADGPLTLAVLERLPGLSRVEIDGDAAGTRDDDDDCARGGRAWGQVRHLSVQGAPRRLLRLVGEPQGLCGGGAGFVPLRSLVRLEATGVPAAALAVLGRCLTRERLPALSSLVLEIAEAGAALDWPFGDIGGDGDDRGGSNCDGDGDGNGGSSGRRDRPLPPPPPIAHLHVHSPHNPPPLGPPTPPARSPEQDDAAPLLLRAAATVTPRLMRALAPTLRSVSLDVFPAAGSAVLVQGEGTRQLVPLEALVGWLGAPGLALERLELRGDVDWVAPDPDAPPAMPPAPGAAAAALAAALAQEGDVAPDNPALLVARFRANARHAYRADRYRRARRRGAADFDAVVAALAPSLEDLVVVGVGGGRPPQRRRRGNLGPAPGPDPGVRARTWLPDCLAGLTRLARLTADCAFDALRRGPRGPVRISDATTGRVPPRLRELTLRASWCCSPADPWPPHRVGVWFDGGVDALAALEVLRLDLNVGNPSLPRCLLDGRMPRLRELWLSEDAAQADPSLLAELALRGRVRVIVGGDTGKEEEEEEEWLEWEAWCALDDEDEQAGGGRHWGDDYGTGSDLTDA